MVVTNGSSPSDSFPSSLGEEASEESELPESWPIRGHASLEEYLDGTSFHFLGCRRKSEILLSPLFPDPELYLDYGSLQGGGWIGVLQVGADAKEPAE